MIIHDRVPSPPHTIILIKEECLGVGGMVIEDDDYFDGEEGMKV